MKRKLLRLYSVLKPQAGGSGEPTSFVAVYCASLSHENGERLLSYRSLQAGTGLLTAACAGPDGLDGNLLTRNDFEALHTLRGVAVEGWVYLPSSQAAASLEVQVLLPGARTGRRPCRCWPLWS